MKSRPTMEELMLQIAELVATRGTCERAQVGCVITNYELTNIVSMGYNGNARGLPNGCDSPEPGRCGCLHAEENALIKAPYEEDPLVMFTTTSPCPQCAKRILNSAVTSVYYRSSYRLDEGLAILATGGVEAFHFPRES